MATPRPGCTSSCLSMPPPHPPRTNERCSLYLEWKKSSLDGQSLIEGGGIEVHRGALLFALRPASTDVGDVIHQQDGFPPIRHHTVTIAENASWNYVHRLAYSAAAAAALHIYLAPAAAAAASWYANNGLARRGSIPIRSLSTALLRRSPPLFLSLQLHLHPSPSPPRQSEYHLGRRPVARGASRRCHTRHSRQLNQRRKLSWCRMGQPTFVYPSVSSFSPSNLILLLLFSTDCAVESSPETVGAGCNFHIRRAHCRSQTMPPC